MEAEVARQVLVAAREGGYLDQEIPESEEEVVKLGQYYAAEAEKAFNAGMNDEAIQRIIDLREGHVESVDEGLEMTQADIDEHVGRSAGASSVPRGEKLPIPPEIEGEATAMPRDLTKLDDREVRRLHGEYNAFLARATWLVAVEAADLAGALALYDDAVRVAYNELPDKGDDGKKVTKADRMEMARLSDSAIEWGRKVTEHSAAVDKFKALKEIYKGHVDRLSREWTMRTDEYERSGNK